MKNASRSPSLQPACLGPGLPSSQCLSVPHRPPVCLAWHKEGMSQVCVLQELHKAM